MKKLHTDPCFLLFVKLKLTDGTSAERELLSETGSVHSFYLHGVAWLRDAALCLSFYPIAHIPRDGAIASEPKQKRKRSFERAGMLCLSSA